MKGTKPFPSLGSLEMPTNMFYTQRIQARLKGVTVTSVGKDGHLEVGCPKGSEPAGGDTSLILQVLGIDKNTPMGRPSDYSV